MAAEVAAAAPNGDFALVSRLQSYGVVTSALGLYNSVKNYTPILSTPLNFAESVAKRGIEVSIPVVKKIDEYTHIDERSVALLDVIETRAAQAKEGISKVNTVAHQPLDTIILALDAYLPANHHGGEVGEPSPKQKSAEEAAADLEESGQARTAITRAKLGLITTHLTQVGVTKLRELQLQGPVHKAIAKQALELVSYSAAVLHLDTLGDSVSQRVADSKQRLFAEAANVSVKVQGFIEQHPRLLSIEKAVEPYALATKSASEAAVLKFITAVAASVDLANHFFANRTADLTDILNKSAKYGAETLASLRKAHPDIEARLTAFVDTLRASLSSTIDTIRRLSAMPIDQLTSAYHSLFQVVQSFEALFASFRQQLLSSVTTNLPFASSGRANPEQIELDVAPTAPEQEEDETVEDNEQSFHHAESHKARRNKKRHH